jgi:CheY-like chemotaxis protein
MHRILVVDDECLVADTLGLIFRKHGFEARVSYSAKDALHCARSFSPELLLCDISMPEQSGLQLAEALHHELPDCKLLMLTAYASNAIKVEQHVSRTRRPLKLLTKPCRPELLLHEALTLLQTA